MPTEEGTHTLPDGHKLYTKTWKSDGPAKARLVFIHGFSDHINSYDSFFNDLASSGIDVYSFDQRGWGRSVTKPSQRGHSGSTDQVLSDITSFISTVIPSPVPLFLMGHSMGGGEVICYAASGPANIRQHIRGYLLESPFVDFNPKSKPSFITVFFGRLAGKLLPHRQLTNKLDANLICRDSEVCQRYRDDDLCHDTGTLEGLAAMLDRTALLAAGKIVVPDDAGEGGVTRIWAGHGDSDGITDFGATKRLLEGMKVKDKEFKGYEGYYHRMHEEPGQDKDVFIQDVVDWIMARAVEPVQVAEGAKPKL